MRQHRPLNHRLASLSLGLFGLAAVSVSLPGCRLNKLFSEDLPPQQVAVVPGAVAQPSQHSIRVSQYVFHTDLELDADAPIFAELSDLREQVTKELLLPPADSVIQVYLFSDQTSYERYMGQRYPELPKRRAFFIAQPRGSGGADDLLVYTFWGEHVRQDLRHELTHALLHSVTREVPLWLDEGLAEFFELAPEYDGVNTAHLLELKQEDFTANLARLEGLREVHEMQQAEYREAWAWAHLMLRGSDHAKRVLLEYLADLRDGGEAPPLRERLAAVFPDPEASVTGHVTRLPLPVTQARY